LSNQLALLDAGGEQTVFERSKWTTRKGETHVFPRPPCVQVLSRNGLNQYTTAAGASITHDTLGNIAAIEG